MPRVWGGARALIIHMDYVQITPKQRDEKLKAVGARTMEDLLKQFPAQLRFRGDLKVPPALDELSLRQHLSDLGGRDRLAVGRGPARTQHQGAARA